MKYLAFKSQPDICLYSKYQIISFKLFDSAAHDTPGGVSRIYCVQTYSTTSCIYTNRHLEFACAKILHTAKPLNIVPLGTRV